MGAKVTFKIANSDAMPAIVDGQIIFVEDQRKIYLDFHGDRKCYTSEPAPVSTDALHYLGVFDDGFDPENGETWKINGSPVSPNKNDMAVYGNKEFLYRAGVKDGVDTVGWFEIGDEDSPSWN